MLPPELYAKAEVVDYKIVSANQVNAYLAEGFILYGLPINTNNSQQSKCQFHQVLIKIRHYSYTSDSNISKLSEIERQCMVLHCEGKKPVEIAKILNRGVRRVREIFLDLRCKLNCGNNTQLILELKRLGLLT